MSSETYNGWANWSTWTFRMWLYDGIIERYVDDNVGDDWKEEGMDRYDILLWIKEDCENELALATESIHGDHPPFIQQIINGFGYDVNFYEIAEHLLQDVETEIDHKFAK